MIRTSRGAKTLAGLAAIAVGAVSAATTAGAAGVLLAGCKGQPVAVEVDAGPRSGGLSPEQAAQVLVHVGDRAITLGDYAAAIEHMSRFDRMRYQAPERRRELLHEMVDVMLLADVARERGYDKDPVTAQEIREVLRDAYFERARAAAPTPAEIPDGDVRAYYEAHKGDFHDPERRRVSAIVLPTEAAGAAALAAARKSSATEWGELVRARSIDPQAKATVPLDLAGDFGFVSPPGDPRGTNARIPEEVRAAVFQAPAVGDVVAQLVKAGSKFYVVKFAGKSDAHDRSLADAERPIRVKLAQDALVAKEEAMVDELRTRFPVQIDEAALAQVKVELPGDSGAE
jgi:peptidyl-prolyl cis-trans isomerase C